jgi:uncharacterized protein involved in exopolysaccharide biosynthesis
VSDADAGPPELDRVSRFFTRHWAVIAVASVLGTITGYSGSFLVQPVYRSEVLVAPATQDDAAPIQSLVGQLGVVAGLAGISPNNLLGDSSATNALALLRSQGFLEGFIQEEDLLPKLFADEWDEENSTWKTGDMAEIPTLEDGYRLFRNRILAVIEDRETDLVTIRVEWTDRIEVARWANELVARVNESARTRAVEESRRAIDFLDRELREAEQVEIRQSIYALLQSQMNKRMLANSRPDFAFRAIDVAHVADEDRYVWPEPLLLALLGLFSGIVVAAFGCLLSDNLGSRSMGRAATP